MYFNKREKTEVKNEIGSQKCNSCGSPGGQRENGEHSHLNLASLPRLLRKNQSINKQLIAPNSHWGTLGLPTCWTAPSQVKLCS